MLHMYHNDKCEYMLVYEIDFHQGIVVLQNKNWIFLPSTIWYDSMCFFYIHRSDNQTSFCEDQLLTPVICVETILPLKLGTKIQRKWQK